MSEQKEKYFAPDQKSYRYDRNGWIFAHLEGSPEERGFSHGYLLAQDILDDLAQEAALIYVQTGLPWSFFRDAAQQLWADKLAPGTAYEEFGRELQGVVEGVQARVLGAEISFEDLLAWNGYEELTDYWFPQVAAEVYRSMGTSGQGTPKVFQTGAPDRCSAFIANGSYTKDGRIVMAHNSFCPFEVGSYLNVILDVAPDTGYPFIMQTQPGYLHSMSDFYENGGGLMITETTIGGFNVYDPEGTPEFLRIRKAAQYADSLDQFFEILWKDNNGGYANTWLVGDVKTNEIMRLEMGLKFYKDDRTTDGAFAGFNAPLDPRIRNFECSNSGFADLRRHQGARQVRIPQLLEEYRGRIDNEVAQRILADHFDVYLNRENPSSRTVCSHYELDDRSTMSQPGRPLPFQPRGAVDGVTATAADAERLTLWARFGNSCGTPFDAQAFFAAHPQFEYLRAFIKDRPAQPWTYFPLK